MAQSGSSAATWRNDRSASKYQKPCNWPTPWSKNCWASGTLRGDREMNAAGAAHQIGLLPRPFVERLAVQRVAGQHGRRPRVSSSAHSSLPSARLVTMRPGLLRLAARDWLRPA